LFVASVAVGTMISLGGDTYTISPFDKDESGDVVWWGSEPIVKQGVDNSWDAHPNDLIGTTGSDGDYIGKSDGRCG